MKNFWYRQWDWLRAHSSRVASGALAWTMSASKAMVRPAYLITMLAILLPVLILLIHTASKAIPLPNIITVNTLSDPFQDASHCSLRGAITSANTGTDTTGGNCSAGTGNDLINFTPGLNGSMTVTGSPLPVAAKTLAIDGTGATVTVDGGGSFQVLAVLGATATLSLNNLTIAHGSAPNGGGVTNGTGATLVVTNCTFVSNASGGLGGASLTKAARSSLLTAPSH